MSWKSIAQNVLNGFVGGALVLTATTANAASTEVRASKFIVVDEHNKKCGELSASNGSSYLTLLGGRSWSRMGVTDKDGASLAMGGASDNTGLLFEATPTQSNISAKCRSGTAILAAGPNESQMAVTRKDAKETRKMILCSVAKDRSGIAAFGEQSAIAVGDDHGKPWGALDWGLVPDTATVTVRSKDQRKNWAQPPIVGK